MDFSNMLRPTLPAWIALTLAAAAIPADARKPNGFDLSGALVSADEILPGGPPRDGIPALTDPKFVAAGQADYLRDDDTVMGIAHNGVAKAYPLRIMNWHELVNDRIGDAPVLVSYCPLCGSGAVYSAQVDGKRLEFGVSGLLYNSDVLFYDRQSESLWSQLKNQAVTGRYKGHMLEMLPVTETTWRDWRARHPDTQVLSLDTGYSRDYGQNPYAGYEYGDEVYFPVKLRSQRYHPKERVLGVSFGGQAEAYPFSELARAKSDVADTLGGTRYRIHFDEENQSARIEDEQGKPLPAVTAYWFAWYAFHPDTRVFKAQSKENNDANE